MPFLASGVRENLLCLDLNKTKLHPLGHRVRPKAAKAALNRDARVISSYGLAFETLAEEYGRFQGLKPFASPQERFYFRFLGGPQNRLTWALDPEHGNDWALGILKPEERLSVETQIAPTDAKIEKTRRTVSKIYLMLYTC